MFSNVLSFSSHREVFLIDWLSKSFVLRTSTSTANCRLLCWPINSNKSVIVAFCEDFLQPSTWLSGISVHYSTCAHPDLDELCLGLKTDVVLRCGKVWVHAAASIVWSRFARSRSTSTNSRVFPSVPRLTDWLTDWMLNVMRLIFKFSQRLTTLAHTHTAESEVEAVVYFCVQAFEASISSC